MGSKETGFSYCDKGKDTGFTGEDDIMYVSSDEKKVINQMYKLKEEYPDLVTIRVEPEDNFGCIVGSVPRKWVVIRPPVKREYTDEQKQETAARLARARALKQQSVEENDD